MSYIDDAVCDVRGVITGPGKYEGELAYVPYFWECIDGETVGDGDIEYLVYIVRDEDRAVSERFGVLLAGVYAIVLWQSDQGFINSREMTAKQLNTFYNECDEALNGIDEENDEDDEDSD